MSQTAAQPSAGTPSKPTDLRETTSMITGYWWVGLVAGIAWLVISLVILQFDAASITTVGILVGLLFLLAAVQNIALTTVPVEHRWVPALFGALFLISAVICFVDPVNTFAALADMLGFLFLLVGVWWMVQAFLERPVNPMWWLSLISGILMTASPLGGRPAVRHEGLHAARLRRDLGADAGDDRHRARVRGPSPAQGAVGRDGADAPARPGRPHLHLV